MPSHFCFTTRDSKIPQCQCGTKPKKFPPSPKCCISPPPLNHPWLIMAQYYPKMSRIVIMSRGFLFRPPPLVQISTTIKSIRVKFLSPPTVIHVLFMKQILRLGLSYIFSVNILLNLLLKFYFLFSSESFFLPSNYSLVWDQHSKNGIQKTFLVKYIQSPICMALNMFILVFFDLDLKSPRDSGTMTMYILLCSTSYNQTFNKCFLMMKTVKRPLGKCRIFKQPNIES